MKISKNQKKKNLKHFLSLLVIFVLLSAAVAFFYINYIGNNDSASEPGHTAGSTNTHSQAPDNDRLKDEVISNDTKTEENGSSPKKASLEITSTNQYQDTLQVRTIIEPLVKDGTCTLVLKQGSSVINQTAGIQPLASYSTCRGFDIATKDLPSGDWSLEISFANNGYSASAKQQIRIE